MEQDTTEKFKEDTKIFCKALAEVMDMSDRLWELSHSRYGFTDDACFEYEAPFDDGSDLMKAFEKAQDAVRKAANAAAMYGLEQGYLDWGWTEEQK